MVSVVTARGMPESAAAQRKGVPCSTPAAPADNPANQWRVNHRRHL
jgi:hypothetical protein